MRGALCAVVLLATAGCGARTGLRVLDGGALPRDAGDHRDAVADRDAVTDRDAGPLVDAGPVDSGPPDEPERDASIAQTRHTLAAGGFFTCALDRMGQVLCWGAPTSRDPLVTARPCDPWACSETPQVVPGVSGAIDVGAGSNGEVCARTTAGDVLCWGGNGYGELGSGSTSAVSPPEPVLGLADAAEVSVDQTTCALRGGGHVSCWGRNDYGVVGDGTTTARPVPTEISGLDDATDLAVGFDDACVVHADGTVSCWGQADYGALGDGLDRHSPCNATDDCALAPGALVAGLDDAIDVAVGVDFACARRRTGGISCWGDDHYGELANGDVPIPCPAATMMLPPQPCERTPVDVVGIDDAVQIDAGRLNGCALRRGGSVVCWGDDGAGQLGDGAFHMFCAADQCSYLPVTVAGITDATEVAVGEFHACARLASGSIVCWGDNAAGELGDGSGRGHSTPVAVLWP